MAQSNETEPGAARVSRHRRNLQAQGAKRVEIIVPVEDAAAIRALAARLRAGGAAAQQLREQVNDLLQPSVATSGQALVDFLRASPLVGADRVLERDRSPGRPVDL